MNTVKGKTFALITLLVAGLLLGITTNLVKVAHNVGMQPLAYLTWSLLGATLLVLVITLLKGRLKGNQVGLNQRLIEYFIVSAFLTTAGANLIFFNAVPRLGVSFVAMLMALPPLITYVAALLMGMERFSGWRIAGVLLALTGTLVLVANQWQAPDADVVWIAVSLMGPVLLAAGNIYRSRRWPPGASAESLVPGMLVAATAMLMSYALIAGEPLSLPAVGDQAVGLVVLQSVVFAGQFLMMFLLQKVGGPVFLSLMGGVSAILGVPIAIGILGEPLIPGFGVSAVLVTMGIVGQLLGWNVAGSNESTAKL